MYMAAKNSVKKSVEISLEELLELQEVEIEHKKGKEKYTKKVKEIEQDYLNGNLTYLESVRQVIKVNKAYNSLIRNLNKKLNEIEAKYEV